MSLGAGASGVRVVSSQMIAIELPNHTMQQHATRPPKASRVLLLLCVMRWRCASRVAIASTPPLLCTEKPRAKLARSY